MIMKRFEKHFRMKSSEIKTRRFGDDISPLSNPNYHKSVNVLQKIVTEKINEAGINKRMRKIKKKSFAGMESF